MCTCIYRHKNEYMHTLAKYDKRLWIIPMITFILLFLDHLCLKEFSLSLWLCWVFTAERRLSLAAVSGGYSLAAVCRLLTAAASLVAGHRL